MTDVDFESLSRCLADEWRRSILDYLEQNRTASFDELIDHVLERETNTPALDRETVTYELYYVHLPMLADHGVLDFDQRTETVSYRAPPELERMLNQNAP